MERDAEATFKSIVDGFNFMTPIVIDYYDLGNRICELSTNARGNMHSKNYFGAKLFGVTNIVYKGNKWVRDFDKDTAFDKKSDAVEYIESLRNENKS